MPTYRIDLEYEGGAFHGWQFQPGRRTVQGVLGDAFLRLTGTAAAIEGAGRTDSGVHALGQVASVRTETVFEPRRLLHALAGLLPPDVRVHAVGRAADFFSARRDAESRLYRYQWLRGPSALLSRHHGSLPGAIDIERMRDACRYLLGDHDFTAFAASTSGGGRCDIRVARIVDTPHRIALEIEADRFLHNMVRRVAGALLDVGRGVLTVDAFAATIDGTVPRGPRLAARGLILVAVRYPVDPVFVSSAVIGAPPVPPWE